jgi:DNA end-binding protein Ku
MASRPIWSGYVQFSLVSMPVKAYGATASGGGGKIQLNQLHKECNSRIRYTKTCPIHGEVPSDQIVSGYQFAENQYVVIEPDELEKLRSAKEKAINIESFLPANEIDPAYYNGVTWYLTPDGSIGQKPYGLLRKVMADTKRVAFARVTLRGRQQLMMLRPVGQGLIAATMLVYDQQVKDSIEFDREVIRTELDPAEMALAKALTEQLVARKFDIAAYRDDYSDKLQQLIDLKVKGQQVIEPPPAAEERGAVINLMEALQRSLAQAKGKPATRGKPPKLAAPGTAEKGAAAARRRKSS